MSAEHIYSILSSRSNKHIQIRRYLKFLEYCNLISGLSDRKELHHILPSGKSLFPEYKNLKEHNWNGIILTPRQHFICHVMLAKIFPENLSAISAVRFMSKQANKFNRGFGRTSVFYEKYRDHFCNMISENKERSEKISRYQRNKVVSEETKKRNSEAAKKRNSSQEVRNKFGELTKRNISDNKMWWQDEEKKKSYSYETKKRMEALSEEERSELFGSSRNSSFYHDPISRKNFRIKEGEEIPEGLVKGRGNFGEDGNFFKGKLVGLDIRSNQNVCVDKNEISPYIIPRGISSVYFYNGAFYTKVGTLSSATGLSRNSLSVLKSTGYRSKQLSEFDISIICLSEYEYKEGDLWL